MPKPFASCVELLLLEVVAIVPGIARLVTELLLEVLCGAVWVLVYV